MSDVFTFSLRSLVRQVCEQSSAADTPTLSKEVFEQIDPDHMSLALQQALPAVVQSVVSQHRMTLDSPNLDQPRRPKSRKVAGYNQLGEMLRARLTVGPGIGDQKFLGDCTIEDLSYAKQIRERMAQANQSKALQYGYLASQLSEHGVATVKELPQPLLTEALKDAA